MRNNKQIIQVNKKEVLDHATGEIKESSQETVSYLPTEPPYVKLYLDDVAKLYGLPKSGSAMLHSLLRKMDFDGVITLVASSKKRMAEEINVKPQTIDNNIQALLKTDILRRAGRSEFMFNPELFARGDWKTISKHRGRYLELSISYTEDGERSIKGEVKSKGTG